MRGEIIGVYVIGGVALDSHGLGSDVDIVLIVEGSRKLDFTELKIKAAETIGLPVDLVVLSRRDLEYHRGNRTRFNLEPPRGVRISWGKAILPPSTPLYINKNILARSVIPLCLLNYCIRGIATYVNARR